MAPDQIEIAALLEALGQWDAAAVVRRWRLAGRPAAVRVGGFTPRINELADLHFEISAADGDYRRFVDDRRVASVKSEQERLSLLYSIAKPRNWRALRECIAAKKDADSNIESA